MTRACCSASTLLISSGHTVSPFRRRPLLYTVPPKEIASPCAPHVPIAPTAIPFSDSAPTRAVRFLYPGCLCGKPVPQTRSPPRANAFAVSRAQELLPPHLHLPPASRQRLPPYFH